MKRLCCMIEFSTKIYFRRKINDNQKRKYLSEKRAVVEKNKEII